MTNHSVLPPSSAARRVACPGSRELEALYPEREESQAAREGHTAHRVASFALECFFDHGGLEILNNETPEGETVTQEMFDGAAMYVNDIVKTIGDIDCEAENKGILRGIEERIDISSIHPDCWGTPDFWCFIPNHLYIWDYKFGHAHVEAFENWQLIEYAAGLLHKLKIDGRMAQQTRVTMRIVQPRCYTDSTRIREWTVLASYLRPYFNRLETMEHMAMEPKAICAPNPECTHCTARHACPALQRSALVAIDISKSNTPWDLNSTALGLELQHIQQAYERLKARKTGLEEQALSMITHGERVYGFTAGSKSTKQIWNAPIEEVKELAEMLGVNVLKPAELVTPKQAITAGMPKKQVDKRSKVITGAVQLIAVKDNEAAKAFGGG